MRPGFSTPLSKGSFANQHPLRNITPAIADCRYKVPLTNHQVELTTGVLGEECSAMMKQFFKELREKQKKIKYEKTLKKED